MKPDELSDAIGGIDTELVEEADRTRKNKKQKRWIKWAALAACFCIAVSAVLGAPYLKENFTGKINITPEQTKTNDTTPTEKIENDSVTAKSPLIAKPLSMEYSAVYPKIVPCPDETDYINMNGTLNYEAFDRAFDEWRDYQNSRTHLPDGYIGDMSGFYRTIIQKLLLDEKGKNVTCSPSNIYMALSMLAEVTDGNSRKQILDLLGAKNVEQLRAQAKAVWESSYENDSQGTLILGNSFWLSDTFKYKEAPFRTLMNSYYASGFAGEMGSDTLNKKLQGWINEQTGGLLAEQAKGAETDPSTVLALVSTVYFKGQWNEKFMTTETQKNTFHGADGDTECDFMYQKASDCGYFDGDGFTAVSKNFIDGSTMYFILPDSGKPEKLIENGKAIDLVLDTKFFPYNSLSVNLTMPKFDVTSDIDLKKSLAQLGVTDIMDGSKSDFTPMTDETGIYCSAAKHAARVTVDEEGCKAAAFTLMTADSEAYIERKEVDFTLDRPFIFAITNADGLPLFFGTVNNL